MIPVEEVDPVLLDQVIRRLLAKDRPPDRELAIALRLGESAELREWVEMLAGSAAPLLLIVYTAISIGMEIGYELGKK